MFAVSMNFIQNFKKLYFRVTMVTAIDDAMTPSWNVAQLIKYIKTKLGQVSKPLIFMKVIHYVRKYIETRLGFQTTNIHESDPLGQEIYGNQVWLGFQTTNIHKIYEEQMTST